MLSNDRQHTICPDTFVSKHCSICPTFNFVPNVNALRAIWRVFHEINLLIFMYMYMLNNHLYTYICTRPGVYTECTRTRTLVS